MNTLLETLRRERERHYKGGLYHKTQIELTYNSNHIEGSRLTHEQTRYMFETNTIGVAGEVLRVDDVIETANHFHAFDMVLAAAEQPLSEDFIKSLHRTLKTGTSDARQDYFAVGDYKRLPNEVGGLETTPPENVAVEMSELIASYERGLVDLDALLDFHVRFERIHPFQDGNGRVGRLILFKECLRHDIVPFIIEENLKLYYYRGLAEWHRERGFLRDTCLTAQDRYRAYLKYFRIDC